MTFAARILSTRLSLLRCAQSHLLRRRSPPSPAGALSEIRHHSLSSHAVRPLFSAGAESLRRDSRPCFPEWSSLLQSIAVAGYSDFSAAEDFVPDFPAELAGPASVCLTFARDRPDLLGMLRMSDIQVVVENLTPFCFNNGDESERRMRSYIKSGSSNELDIDKANMVDLMKYILSYISNPTYVNAKSDSNAERVESSLKNLLSDLAKLNYGVCASSLSGSAHGLLDGHEQALSSVKKVEMKKGDWTCPRCSFMNFARNLKCLECEEARPKRQFLNGEWECPQCDFFNYGRNTVCLRCEGNRPSGVSLGSINMRSGSGFGNMTDSVNSDLEKKLAANEEKAQRWFSKISDVSSTSDMSSAMEDDDFPEIMPLRKGVNKFVVSTCKTPLERRLANSSRHQSDPGDGVNSVNETLKERISRSLDEILGHSSAASDTNEEIHRKHDKIVSSSPHPASDPLRYENLSEANSQETVSQTWNQQPLRGSIGENRMIPKSNFVGDSHSFLDGGEQNRSSESSWKSKMENGVARNGTQMGQRLNQNSYNPSTSTDASWKMKYPNQRSASIETKGTQDNGNSFQTGNNDGWGNQLSDGPNAGFATNETGTTGGWFNNYANVMGTETWRVGNLPPRSTSVSFASNGSRGNSGQNSYNPQAYNTFDPSSGYSQQANASFSETQHIGNPSQNTFNPQTHQPTRWSNGHSHYEAGTQGTNMATRHPQTSSKPNTNVQNTRVSWSGKRIEDSGVREPDVLDMSEEAKAERWFKRVAEIKDISELSKIPDEDFPSIMPMRKGVNRFVVSKRKTPLERRLTSQHYRRNLPTVTSSESLKNENEE